MNIHTFCASKQREKGRELKLEKERDNVSNNWIYMRVHVPRFRCSAHLKRKRKRRELKLEKEREIGIIGKKGKEEN